MINNILKILACILIIVLIVGGSNSFWNFRLLTQELRATSQNTKNLTARTNEYIEYQLDLFQSEPYQKSIKAGIDTAAIYNSVGRSINTVLLPRIYKTADSTNLAVNDLRATIQSSNTLVTNADRELFGDRGLIRSLTSLTDNVSITVTKLNTTVDSLDLFVKEMSVKLKMSADEIYALIASPEWKQAIQNLNSTTKTADDITKKVDLTVESIRLAMEKAPSIAASMEKIASVSSKFTKVSLIVGILSTIIRTFVP